jgi:hypothetical protein
LAGQGYSVQFFVFTRHKLLRRSARIVLQRLEAVYGTRKDAGKAIGARPRVRDSGLGHGNRTDT